MIAKIEKQTLSDGSIAYNVIATIEELQVRFACVDKDAANKLVSGLNNTSWAEYELL